VLVCLVFCMCTRSCTCTLVTAREEVQIGDL
jgi:hypothetical protein